MGPLAALAIVVCASSAPRPLEAQTVRGDFYVTNGTINSQILWGQTLYVGGSFSFVGPVTGAGVPIDSTTGQAIAGFPQVSGQINAVAPDGAGGWFIGGTFTSVGGIPRNNLARILSDNSVSSWNPGTNSSVRTIAVDGGIVYVGGTFTSAGGQSRNRIAAIDAGSGAATAWDPDASGAVFTLAVDGSTVYAGGQFTSIGGQSRNRIAALDSGTGLATGWNPNSNSQISALQVDGALVYAGGSFTFIGGQPRNRIAAIDAGTGAATTWNPNSNSQVLALAIGPGTVYVGGTFTSIGGQPRNRIAAVDATTGSPTTWNPGANSQVLALLVSGATVYAGGDFLTMGGQERSRIAAIDAATGSVTSWNPGAYGTVSALSTSGGVVYAGGAFTGMGGLARNNLAAFDVASGAATAWDPNADGQVLALAAQDNTIYVGGQFSLVGGQTRANIAALDGGSGAATGWDPGCNGQVSALAIDGSTLYVGGLFTTIGGQPRANIAALDSGTAVPTAWDPGANDQLFALTTRDGVVYAGGQFTSLGGQSRNRIGAVDALSAAATAWDPNSNGTVRALTVSCGTVYAGGFFTTIGGQARNDVAALNTTNGQAGSWNPSANGPVFGLALEGPILYVGGVFNIVGGQIRNRIASLSVASGAATAWDPNSNGTVRSVLSGGGSVYAGGQFTAVGGQGQANLAAISADNSITCPTIAVDPTSAPEGRVGTAYSFALTGSGGSGPYCFALSAGSLPPGLTLNAGAGAITGTPTAPGTFGFTVSATDAAGCSGSRAYSILVRPVCPTIAIAPPTLPAGRVAEPYAQTVTTTAGTPPFTWSLVTGGLPAGLSLDPGTGAITGTPTTATVASFTIGVIDSNLCTGSQAYNLTIRPVCPALAVLPPALPDGTVGTGYADTLTAPGAASPLAWSVSSGSLPAGLTLDPGTGAISGIPTATGTSVFTLMVSDSNVCTANRSYTVTVFASPPVSSVAANAGGRSISIATPCVSVPMVLTRGEATPLRALSVTFQIDTATLSLCTPATPTASIHAGSWLASFPLTNFQVTDHGGGAYTVDQVILGTPCGATDGGEAFTLDLAAVGGDGFGAITVIAVKARDCDNTPVAVGQGPPGLLAICNSPIAITPAVLPDGSVGTPYARTVTAGSGVPPYTWSVTSGALPPGLSLDTGTGAISGTPNTSDTYAFTVAVVDPNGCGGERSYTMTVFAEPPVSSIAADATGLCVSTAHACVSVPVTYQRAEAAPARGVSVTFQLDTSKLILCSPSDPASSIHMGSWLTGFPTNFQVTDNGGGSYTVDQTILGSPCGVTVGGDLFTVDVKAAGGDGIGTITMIAVKTRDCGNAPIPVLEGPVASVPVQTALPAAITDLGAVQVPAGNGAQPTTGITVSWSTGGAGTFALYRAPFGAYPVYDRDGPVSQPSAATAPGAPWQLVTASAVSGFVDNPPRGFWYYVAFVKDSCDNLSVVSNRTAGVLDYLLGDVSDGATAGQGDNRVRTEDISLLGAYYGISGAAITTAGVDYLDVGPTTDGQPTSRPTPDASIDFEDLMIFSTNFGSSASAPQSVVAGHIAEAAIDEFSLTTSAAEAAGDTVDAVIRLHGGGRLQGFSVKLAWNPAVVTPLRMRSGGLIEDQGGLVLEPRPGTVDAALLGAGSAGISGEGEIATVSFRALRRGDAGIRIAEVIARDAHNRPVATTAPAPSAQAPSTTALDGVAPNPGRGRTTVWFSLARDAQVDVSIYSVDGRRVRRVLDGMRPAGFHQATWDGADDRGSRVAPGVYYVRLTTTQGRFTRKVVLIR